ncbi:Alpha/Beta hydrolase protein [Ilyonectria sp. MPI-CAGE-AT-0026]|nr:Alpha/Beta hydrolase protein [Ilyonectria sp. MPI-CAGE-AT-0026]
MTLKTIRTPTLEIGYYEHGPTSGWPVVLSHGFPYDIHSFDEVAPILASNGARVIIPYLRGFGPTRFLSATAMRTGQQAALGSDVIELLDALDIEKAILGGFDWGGVASCVAAAIWPDRVDGLVSYAGYDIVDRVGGSKASEPSLEYVQWYQHLFQHERGRACLEQHRRDLCLMLWRQWSPTFSFSNSFFERTAASFDNPDFVDIVIHAYRFCFGSEEGDPVFQLLEDKLASKPLITVPSITLDGLQDPLKPGGTAAHSKMFSGRHERREADVGHAFPMEAPQAFADAILSIHEWNTRS